MPIRYMGYIYPKDAEKYKLSKHRVMFIETQKYITVEDKEVLSYTLSEDYAFGDVSNLVFYRYFDDVFKVVENNEKKKKCKN